MMAIFMLSTTAYGDN